MALHSTPTPAPPLAAVTSTPLPGTVTVTVNYIVTKGMDTDIGTVDTDDGAFAALIGGLVGSLLLVLICIIAVLLWCVSRQKGSYVTNEMDEEDDDDDEMDEDGGSDAAPLKTREDE